MNNPDLKELSARLSCSQMTEKAKKEIAETNNRFLNILEPIKPPNCINYDGYLPTFTVINKRSCIVKKPEYNEGSCWGYYFDDNLKSSTITFNKQTKNKYNPNNYC